MSKKIKKKSAKSKKHYSAKKKAVRNDDLWKTSAMVLGFLLVLSIFTNGFRLGVNVDSVMEDLKTLRNKNVPAEYKAAAENSLEEFEAAVDYFTRTIEMNHEYVEAYYNRGFAYELLKDVENSRRDYEKVLELYPNYELAIDGLNRISEFVAPD